MLFVITVVDPVPSQRISAQSPGICEATGVPAAVNSTPHDPTKHVRFSHSVSCPGQSAAVMHWTHAPMALHCVPLPSEHGEPSATGECDGIPAIHASSVHALLSFGMSMSSFFSTTSPTLSQTRALQSPVSESGIGVPSGTNVVPQILLLHVATVQRSSGIGQSVGVLHDMLPTCVVGGVPVAQPAKPNSVVINAVRIVLFMVGPFVSSKHGTNVQYANMQFVKHAKNMPQ